MLAVANLVPQHTCRTAVVEDHHVGVAVVVEIPDWQPARHLEAIECRPRRGR